MSAAGAEGAGGAGGAEGGPGDGLAPAQAVVEAALAAAGTRAQGCVVLVEEVSEAEVRWAANTTTTNGTRRSRRTTVVCMGDGGTPGQVTAGVARQSGEVDVEALVAAAAADAAVTPPAADASPLLTPTELGRAAASVPRFDDPPATTDLSALSGVVGDLVDAFSRAERAGHVLAGFAQHRATTTYLGTSTGVRLGHTLPDGTVELVARTSGGSASTWAGQGTDDFADVNLAGLEERVVGRLGWATRSVELPAGRYEVVLPPEAVCDLVLGLAFELGGQDAADGQTVFSRPGGGDRVGEVLSSVPLDLWSDPAEPGLECRPFLATGRSSADTSVFDNAMPLERTSWMAGGRLERLRRHRAGARRAGLAPAGFVGNLSLAAPGATATLEEMVAATERGLLLTCFWYIREVDPVTALLTGLARDGVYVVEDGQVVGATTNFRFNESPVNLLGRVSEVGASRRALAGEFGEALTRTVMPALRVPDFNMSSVSRAS